MLVLRPLVLVRQVLLVPRPLVWVRRVLPQEPVLRLLVLVRRELVLRLLA